MDAATREIVHLQERLCQLRAELRAPLETEALRGETAQVLTAWIGDARVAFLVQSIGEVVPMPALAALPEAPPWVTGLLDLRGQLVPVIDVAARIARASRTARASDFVVLCTEREAPVGLVVTGIEQVQALAVGHYAEPPTDVPLAPYVLRVARDARGDFLLLSIEALARTSDLPSVRQ